MHLLMMNQVGHLSLLPEDEEIISTSDLLFPPTQPACFDPKKRMNRMVWGAGEANQSLSLLASQVKEDFLIPWL